MNLIRKTVFLLLLILPIFSVQLFATHNMGKDIQYSYVGRVNGLVQYKITVRFYRNCWDSQSGTGAVNPPSVLSLEVVGSSCAFTLSTTMTLDNQAIPANGTEISELCAAQTINSGCNWTGAGNPAYPGVQIFTYSKIISVPEACTTITVGTTDCCRNGAISNLAQPDSRYLSIKATINNAIDPNTGMPYINNSALFYNSPVSFACINSMVTYNHGTIDADGDSLVYSLISPLEGNALPYSSIPYTTNYSDSCPVLTNPANSFNFNTKTGEMLFTTNLQQQCALAVRVDEYRRGVLVGSTMRDIHLVLLNCAVANPVAGNVLNLQQAYLADSANIVTCQGTDVEFDVVITDPTGHNIAVSSNVNQTPSSIPGAVVTSTGTGSAVSVHFAWSPQLADTGIHYFSIKATTDDCPITGKAEKVFGIQVLGKARVVADNALYCAVPVQLNASYGTNVYWWPTGGLSDTTVLNPVATPAVPTWYHVTTTCGTDSVFINVLQPFTLYLTADTVLCSTDALQLQAAVADDTTIAYHWQTDNGLISDDTLPDPVVRAYNKSHFYCTATDTNGCVVRDTVVVNAAYKKLSVVVSDTTVCSGKPLTLTASVGTMLGPACSVSALQCTGVLNTQQVGAGVVLSPAGSPINYPTLYGGYKKGVRTQILYRRSDLLQALGGGGYISQLAFEIGGFNSTANLGRMEISLGCTNADSLNGWQYNTVQVYKRDSYIPVSGWNTHMLDSMYYWDGSSNLLVEICRYDTSSAQILNNKTKGATAGYRCMYYSAGNTDQCGNTNTPVASAFLPNMRISYCGQALSTYAVNWSSTVLPNVVEDSTNIQPVIYPDSTNSYFFTVYDSLCPNLASSAVRVAVINGYESIKADSICAGGSYYFNGVYYTQPGVYPVTFIAANGCDSVVTLTLQSVVCSDIDEPDATIGIAVVPNPVGDYLNINGDITAIDELKLYDVQGKLLCHIHKPAEHTDVSNYAGGLYVMELQTGDRFVRLKWVKD